MEKYNHIKIQLLSALILSFISAFCFSQTGPKFHDTQGGIEVNRVGQLQYTLPIDIPPGVKTVAPQVSLTYTSGTGNGISGYGWSISGITAITRIGKNIENTGEVKEVQMDYSDYYSFNGKRLILKSGEYGKDGAEYVTEQYSNTKFKSVGSENPAQPWQGPEYWEVTFEDGSQALYGLSPDARTSTDYNISEWRDPQGNYISYSYSPVNRITLLGSISWGGNKGMNTPHMNTIQFNYTDRDLKEESYIQGIRYYQSKILSEVKVFADNTLFKRYGIEYTTNGTNYQFISQITEYNNNNEPANPVIFSYPAMENSSYKEFLESQSFENVKLVGDFNGDSYLDFLMNDGTVKLGAFNETFSTISTGKIFGGNAKVVSTLLDEEGQIYNGNGIVEFKDGKVVGYIFRNNNFVKVFEKDLTNTILFGPPDFALLEVGDFNGDGIPDAFVDNGQPNGFNSRGIIDLKDPNAPAILIVSTINNNSYPDQKYMDIDGDGKVEIISVSGSVYTVLEFIKTGLNTCAIKIKFSGNLLETKDPEFPVLFGDFNGDGKLDFTIPITDYAIGKPDDWRFYIGTDKGFNPFLKKEFFTYRKFQKEMSSNYAKFAKQYFFSVTDMNKDGKSDIVQVFSYNQINMFNAGGSRDFGYVVSAKLANGSDINGIPNFTTNWSFQSPQFHTQDLLDLTLFSPITNSIKSGNNYYNVFLYWKDLLNKIQGPTPVSELARVSSITQGGVTTNIKYLEVVPDNTINSNFYKKEKKEVYPYYSLSRVDQAYAVSQLLKEGRKQDFRYRGLIGNLAGKKMIGYHQVARSSWYADGFENTKIWTGSQISPLLDGAPVKEWSIRTNNESDIFPTDISENNAQLLSFESVDYKADKLLNGQVVSSVPAGSLAKIVTAVVPTVTKTKDFSTGTFIQKVTAYENYYLPAKIEINTNYGYGITTTEFDYTHNIGGTGTNYYVGRPTHKAERIAAYNDIHQTFTTYTYENNLLKSSRFFPGTNSTQAVTEEYSYDGFGNITGKKTISGIDGNSKNQKDEYDPTGRFVVKKTDNLSRETKFTYNNLGQILTQTDPDGNTLINSYDVWGKLTSSTSSLAGTTTYLYEKDNQYNKTITSNAPDDDISKVFTNKWGQEYKIISKAFGQGQYVSREIMYDVLGRKVKESEPYFEGQTASQWNTLAYDDTVFPAKVKATAFTGKQLETSILGLTTKIKETSPLDYGRTTSQTIDALGNVILSSDKGGTVEFSYNALNQQIQAKYEEHTVTTKYDEWGNKIKVDDPSTGIYEYEYNGFMGALSRVISPRGEKSYKYNSLGQLTFQNEYSVIDGGATTNKEISFNYDIMGRLVSKEGISGGNQYTYTVKYDQQGRMSSYLEQIPEASFSQNEITYDSQGRIAAYVKQLKSQTGEIKVFIRNRYNPWNGELYQVIDNNTGKVLWELQETNANGLVLKNKLGAADIVNMYDANGFLTNINHSSVVKPDILKISYSFDAVKNELKNRKAGAFTEYFDYDDNNRLVNWTDPVSGIKPSNNRNIYDIKGRILVNDEVGTMKYENPGKIYQPTGMTLNAAGGQNYDGDLIQNVLYNANNDPVSINGEKSHINFGYGLTNMRQKVEVERQLYAGHILRNSKTASGIWDSNDPEWQMAFTKLYSEDGSFEVIKDPESGLEKQIIYIGDTPYESNIVFLKDFAESDGSFKFLHKDYLGSILAISDEAGNRLEHRHFDAWGILTHLQIGNGPIVTDRGVISTFSLLIDRGYTGHEHFMDVGIIHMNGRLYDPLLRRFLSADENIQDPFNTQFYNRYGYVMNNPMMYNDPNGEFAWIIVGAVIGGYLTGVKANGSWNPVKWNWGATWGKIAMGAAVGAFTGGVGAAVGASAATAAAATWGINGGLLGGAIAGASGGAVAGAINGFATAVMFGEDVIEGTVIGGLSGAAIGGVVGGISGTIGQMVKNAQAAKIGAPQGTILKDAPIAQGRSAWTFNNTPKITTVGATAPKPQVGNLVIGDVNGGFADEIVGYELANEGATKIPIYEETPKFSYQGEASFTKSFISNEELVSQAAIRAEKAIGGTGRFAGTIKHSYATTFIKRYQNIFGDRGIRVNEYFKGPNGKGYLDVHDQTNGVIYDFKFGNPVMRSSQFNKYYNTFGQPVRIVDQYGNIIVR